MKASMIALSVALAATGTPAIAQDRQDQSETDIVVTGRYSAEDTSTASKAGQPILLTPQSVQVVTRQVLLDQNAITLTDAVRNVAGVSSDFGFGVDRRGKGTPLAG